MNKSPHRVVVVDTITLDGVEHRSADGYLAAYAYVARTGLQTYKGFEVGRKDLDDVVVYRPEAEVFSRDAMHSFAHRPITLDHPPEMVNSNNWKKYAAGHTGDEIIRDGDSIRVPMVLMDQRLIDSVKDGTRELSMGYTTDLQWTPGNTPDGQKYDAVQTDIRANHVAFVKEGRAGPKYRFGDRKWLDEATNHAGDPILALTAYNGTNYCPNCGVSVQPEDDDCWSCKCDLKAYRQKEGSAYDAWSEAARAAAAEARSGGGGEKLYPHADLSRSQLEAKYAKQGEENSRLGQQMIEAGRGYEKPSETHTKSDPLSQKVNAAAQRHIALVSELRRREKFHGSHNPLPQAHRQSFYSADTSYDDRAKCADCGGYMGDGMICDKCGGRQMANDTSFTAEERRELAKKGQAKPDGSYPIRNRSDLEHAIRAWGRGGATESDKSWITKRARALGATSALPEDWGVKDSKRKYSMITLNFDGVPVEVADETQAAFLKKYVSKLVDDAEKKKGKKSDEDDCMDDDADEEMEREKKERAEDKKALDAIKGENAVLKKQLEDALASSSPAALDAMLADRAAVIDAAYGLLPPKFDVAGKSIPEIRRAAVSTKLGDSVKDLTDDAVVGAFAALTSGANRIGGVGDLARSLSGHARATDRMPLTDERDAAYEERNAFLQNAWRNGNKVA